MSPRRITRQFIPISEIKTQDVLFGKGGLSASQIGTIAFKAVIESRLHTYINANLSTRRNADKTFITLQVVNLVHLTGGRFLVEEEATPGNMNRVYLINGTEARVRVREFFREFIKKWRKQRRPCALLDKMGLAGLFNKHSTYGDIIVYIASSPHILSFLCTRNEQIEKRKQREQAYCRSSTKKETNTDSDTTVSSLPDSLSMGKTGQVSPLAEKNDSSEYCSSAASPGAHATIPTVIPRASTQVVFRHSSLQVTPRPLITSSSTEKSSWSKVAAVNSFALLSAKAAKQESVSWKTKDCATKTTLFEPYPFLLPEEELERAKRRREGEKDAEKKEVQPSSSSLVTHLMTKLFDGDEVVDSNDAGGDTFMSTCFPQNHKSEDGKEKGVNLLAMPLKNNSQDCLEAALGLFDEEEDELKTLFLRVST